MTEPAVDQTTAPARPWMPWMTVKQVAAYSGYHRNYVEAALREYDRTKNTKEPRGLKGHQRKARGWWHVHRDDVDRWLQGLPPTKGIRRFAAT